MRPVSIERGSAPPRNSGLFGGFLPNQDGELIKPIVLQQRDRPPVARQAMRQHANRIGIIKVRTPPLWIARQAQQIKGKSASSHAGESIDGLVNVGDPGRVRNLALDVEYSARDGEVDGIGRLRANPPLPIRRLAVKRPGSLDHARRNVVADKFPAMALRPQETQEVAASAAASQ